MEDAEAIAVEHYQSALLRKMDEQAQAQKKREQWEDAATIFRRLKDYGEARNLSFAKMFGSIDEDGMDGIDFEEFEKLMRKTHIEGSVPSSVIRNAFDYADRDGGQHRLRRVSPPI